MMEQQRHLVGNMMVMSMQVPPRIWCTKIWRETFQNLWRVNEDMPDLRNQCACCTPAARSCSKRFISTGFLKSKADKIAELVQKITFLGDGIYLKTEECLHNCTHVICETPVRSEKFLGALASGKWVLTPDYIEASFLAKCWLPEKAFEWNCKFARAEHKLPKFMYEAPKVCRRLAQQSVRGLFKDWDIVLAIGSRKATATFQRLITVGGGKVCQYGQDGIIWSAVTHVFVDPSTKPAVISWLKLQRLPLLHKDYVRNYILQQPIPPSERLFNLKRYKEDSDMLTRTWNEFPVTPKNTETPKKHFKNGRAWRSPRLTIPVKPLDQGNVNKKKILAKPKVAVGPLDAYFKTSEKKSENTVKITLPVARPVKLPMVLRESSRKRKRDAENHFELESEPPRKNTKVVDTVSRKGKHENGDEGARNLLEGHLRNYLGDVAAERVAVFDNDDPDVLKTNATILDAVANVRNEMSRMPHWKPHFVTFCSAVRRHSVNGCARELQYHFGATFFQPESANVISLLERMIMPKQYLQSALLNQIFELAFKYDNGYRDQVYKILRKTLLLHPPFSVKMQDFYIRVLGRDEKSNNVDCDRAWQKIVEILRCLNEKKTETKKILTCRIMMQFLVQMFEVDFQNFLTSNEEYGEKMKMRKNLPLVARLLWANSEVGHLSNTCKKLICEAVAAGRGCASNAEKLKNMMYAWDIVSIVAECCRLTKDTRGIGANVKLNSDADSLCFFITQQILSAELVLEDLRVLLGEIRPSWLLAKISASMLERQLALVNAKFPDLVATSVEILLVKRNVSKDVDGGRHVQQRRVAPLKEINASPIRQKLGRPKIVNGTNGNGETKLQIACRKNDVMSVKMLLKEPEIDLNVQDYAGWTALHEASLKGHVDCVRLLLEHKPKGTDRRCIVSDKGRKPTVDLMICGAGGVTVLHDAVINNRVEVVKLLLQHGGSELLKVKMTNGKTASDLAVTKEMKTGLENFSKEELKSRQMATADYTTPGTKLINALFASLLTSYGEATGVDKIWRKISTGSHVPKCDIVTHSEKEISNNRILGVVKDLRALHALWKLVTK